MSGIGKQLRGSGIAKPGFQSKQESIKEPSRQGLKMGGMGNVGKSPRLGSFLKTMGEYKGLSKNPTLMAKGGSSNWIQGAIKHPGALRASLHVKAGEKIPAKKLSSAAKKSGILGKRARLAQTLRSFKK